MKDAATVKFAPFALLIVVSATLGCVGAPPVNSPTIGIPTASAPTATATLSPEATVKPSTSASPVPTPSPFRIVHLPAPIGPIVVADFDNDGNLDIAGVTAEGTVSLWHGDGNGSFEQTRETPGGNGPAAIGAADLNRDGRLDIVVTLTGVSDMGNGDDDIVVLLAKPDGTFEHLVKDAGVNPQALVLADFNGDNKPDLATANEGDQLSIFMGVGDGTLADPVGYAIGAPFASGIAAADFNTDGKLDLVTTNSLIGRGRSDRTISVLLGAGDGTFAEPHTYDVGGPQPIMPVVADFNGDGEADVAMPDGYPTHDLSVLLGLGDGGFGPSTEFQSGPNDHTLVTADVDGDGHPDLIAGNLGEGGGPTGKGIALLLGLGDGTFKPGVDLVGNKLGEQIGAAADLDGDGTVDLIMVGNNELLLLFNAISR